MAQHFLMFCRGFYISAYRSLSNPNVHQKNMEYKDLSHTKEFFTCNRFQYLLNICDMIICFKNLTPNWVLYNIVNALCFMRLFHVGRYCWTFMQDLFVTELIRQATPQMWMFNQGYVFRSQLKTHGVLFLSISLSNFIPL